MQPILVFSPEPSDHKVWIHLLRERGYSVCVSDSSRSTASLLTDDPSLVIFDLPTGSPLAIAWQEMEELRAEYSAVPLVVLLPPNLPEGYRRLFEGGTNGCLQKPVDYAGLLRLVDMFVVRQTEKRRIELGIGRVLSLTPA